MDAPEGVTFSGQLQTEETWVNLHESGELGRFCDWLETQPSISTDDGLDEAWIKWRSIASC